MELFELDLVFFVWKLFSIFQKSLANNYTCYNGHIFQSFQQFRRSIIDAATLGALHKLIEKACFIGFLSSTIHYVEKLYLREIVVFSPCIGKEKLLSQDLLELRQLDHIDFVVELL